MAAALGGESGDALPPEGKTIPLGDDDLNFLQVFSLFVLLDDNDLFPSRSDMDAPD